MANERPSTWRLVVGPALITFLVTVVRVIGERNQWAPVLFNRGAGGAGAIVGISWLAPVFGIWFALRLGRAGAAPERMWTTILMGIFGIVAMMASAGLVFGLLHFKAPGPGIVFFLLSLASVLPMAWAWPALWKALFAYALLARIPVVVVMFFAMQGNWGTHYDATKPGTSEMSLWPKFLWFGVLPQLTIWVAITLSSGMLIGGAAEALRRRRRALPSPATT
ncbi:MAG: hypothetical protein HYR85_06725 [Planctomycetes bacterium]|nr:hypothetical protein [Planctomycetota bacterium]